MANTIASAVRYINNDAELQKIFAEVSYTADLEKPNQAIGGKTIKYRKVSFGSTVLGTYNRATGYVANDLTVTWEEKSLTQDKGNSLSIDKMDSEEAQSLEIANVHNKWVREIMTPSVDTYRFSQIAGATGITKPSAATLSADDVEAAIDTALDTLFNKGVKNDVLLYISTSCARLLKNAAKGKGTLSLGAWGGNLTSEVLVYGDTIKAKVVQVPESILGAKVNFMLLPAPSVAAMVKYQENVYFDKIPGFGGRKAEVDSGIYHDCWVEPGAEKAVYVHVHA